MRGNFEAALSRVTVARSHRNGFADVDNYVRCWCTNNSACVLMERVYRCARHDVGGRFHNVTGPACYKCDAD